MSAANPWDDAGAKSRSRPARRPTAQAAPRRPALPPRPGSAGSIRLSAERAAAQQAAEERRPGRLDHPELTFSPKRSRMTDADIAEAVDEAEFERLRARPRRRRRTDRYCRSASFAPRRRPHQAHEDLVDAGAGAPSAAPRPSGPRAGTGRASPCSRPRCGPGARCRSARSADRSRSSPRPRRSSRRWRPDRQRSRRPRRRSCSRPRLPHPRRRRRPAASSPRPAPGCA